jgi:hypothetical protein
MKELNQRVHDLVRFMRQELHTEGLITDEEYAQLAGDHGAVQRLEDYDAAIERIQKQSLSDPRRPSGLVSVLIQEIADLNRSLHTWQREFHMYRHAWLREIGGGLLYKGHDIDAFVATTQWALKEAEKRGFARRLTEEDFARKDGDPHA